MKLKHLYIISLLLFLGFQTVAQQLEWKGAVELFGGVSSGGGDLPFWFYTNTQSNWAAESNFYGLAEAESAYNLSQTSSITAKASFFYRNNLENGFQRKELYVRFTNNWIRASVGAFSTINQNEHLSASRKNFLFSGNVRPIPGVLFEAPKPVKISDAIGLDWGIGHYQLNDDRFVRDTRVHYKRLGVWVQVNEKNRFKAQIQHYAQWAGTSPVFGELKSDFEAFVDVFTARRSSETNADGEIINAVGNHLGSYLLDYYTTFSAGTLNLYHEHPFEDGSGTALKNFPDGIWGIAFKPNNTKWFQGVSYEYIQTTDQGGNEGISSIDNYFSNNIYRSGWSYDGAIIGVPFIGFNPTLTVNDINSPIFNNRIQAHHFAAEGAFNKWHWMFATSFVKNFGTYRNPFEPARNVQYYFSKITYQPTSFVEMILNLGIDSNSFENNFGFGFGFRCSF